MTLTEIESELKRVTVVGMGLMGGSLAMALKRKAPGIELTAVDLPEVIEDPVVSQLADRCLTPEALEEAVSQADLVVLATSIGHIQAILPRVATAVKSGALITDMGSTKAEIMARAQETVPPGVHFIGGHPMTGREGRGIHAGDPLLFENAVYVLTPQGLVPPAKTQALGNLLERTGAKVLFLSPALHDRIAAGVSHLPQLLAVTLTNLVAGYQSESSHYIKLAAGGFRDMTRIASSPWSVWQDILASNQAPIAEFLDAFITALQETRNRLGSEKLSSDFQSAARSRLSIPRDTRGFLRPQFDLIVWVEDRHGVIAEMATALANEAINIKDIEVIKVREGDAGTMRLALESENQRLKARDILEKLGYTVKLRNQ